MISKYKKILSLCLSTAIIATSSISLGAAAFEIKIHEGGNVFSKPWESWTTRDGLEIKYGFSTWLVDEDYSKSYHPRYYHNAAVHSGANEYAQEVGAQPGRWSNKADVKHTNGTVIYKAWY